MVICENFASWFRNLESTFTRWDPSSQFAKSTSNAGLHRNYAAAIQFKFRTVKFQFRKVRNCPSAWCSCLPKAISSSFQLQIIYGLKRWIFDFLSFQMVYGMQKMDFWKCSKSSKEDCSCFLHSVFFTLFSSSPLLVLVFPLEIQAYKRTKSLLNSPK